MLVAAAVCPCPPLLVPEVAGGAAPELTPVRDACTAALGRLAAARPDRLVVAAPDADGAPEDGCTVHPAGTPGSFQRFGVPLAVALRADPDTEGAQKAARKTAETGVRAEAELPPALAVGAWLLAAADWSAAPVSGLAVPPDLSPDRCQEAGLALADDQQRTALLVLGDGSACRSRQAPGYLDDRAEVFDAAVGRAFADGDAAALARIDPELAAELRAAGRPVWQLLAGAAGATHWQGTLTYAQAPYGVGYFVASWSPARE